MNTAATPTAKTETRLQRAMDALETAFLREGSPWPWLAVIFLALVPHLHGLRNGFVFDDWDIIPGNPLMADPHAFRKIFGGSVAAFLGDIGVSNYYRPLMHVFHYFIYQAFGPNPAWFHAFCFALHAGICVLLMAVVRRMTGNGALALLAALLFSVHPLNTEVVAWISASPDLLSSFFALLCTWLYFRATAARGRRRALLVAGAGLSLFLANLSKEIAILFPVLIAAGELLATRRPLWRHLRERIPEYGALAGATLAYFALRTWVLGGLLPVDRRLPLPWPQHLWTALAVFWRYVSWMLWPLELNCLRYYWPSRSVLEPAVVAGIVCVAAVVTGGVLLWRRKAPETVALLLCVAPLAPMFLLPYRSNVLLIFERAAYLPLAGFCWLAAAGLLKLAKRWGSPVVLVLTVAVLAGYSARSAMRVSDWGDEIALYQEGVAHSPDPFHPLFYQAQSYLRLNRPVEAVANLTECVRLHGTWPEGENELGHAYAVLKKPGPALSHYRLAAALWLKEGRHDFAARALNNMGISYRSQGADPEAMAAYRRAIELDPRFAQARNNLGYLLLLEGRLDEAVGELQGAVREAPAELQAHANLGLAYRMQGRLDAALSELTKAERIAPADAEVQARLGEVDLVRGQPDAARQRFERAIQLDGSNQRARAGLAQLPGVHAAR